MPLKLDLVGKTSAPRTHTYTWKDVILYALGVGAKAGELDYLLEHRGPHVLPTFAVVPCFDAMLAISNDLGADPKMIVHGEQKIVLHRAIPSSGTLSTTCEVKGIYDKGKGALAVVEAKTVDAVGAPVFDNVFSIFVRGAGGFGGERGPEAPKTEPPTGQAPAFSQTEGTTREQALLYRLSGDHNPLHADPAFAQAGGFDRPILHGLCTYGHAGRAVLAHGCGGDATRLRSFAARFSAPVWPGDTLTTEGWWTTPATLIVTTKNQDGKFVLANGLAEVAPA